ncbi:hypothetical protein BDR05DRAFT_673609 [Suillus weaverae]|nr:hypothetical protein BDR05DRAFT_673609 [Suillus weaverae]
MVCCALTIGRTLLVFTPSLVAYQVGNYRQSTPIPSFICLTGHIEELKSHPKLLPHVNNSPDHHTMMFFFTRLRN